jgi:starch-binding outer membrane protein, SusD/RagB family
LLDSGEVAKAYTAASIASKVVGAYELYMAGTYEENELMKAEANIKLGNIATGLSSIDAVRTYQAAGLPAVSGVITDPVLAYEELRKERRVGLIFRQLSFYDARRWGVLDDVSAGGGRTNCVVVNANTGALNTKATINYNFVDYWDVPDDETVLNPPSSTSAPVKNPK